MSTTRQYAMPIPGRAHLTVTLIDYGSIDAEDVALLWEFIDLVKKSLATIPSNPLLPPSGTVTN